jgi:hypothetical protein
VTARETVQSPVTPPVALFQSPRQETAAQQQAAPSSSSQQGTMFLQQLSALDQSVKLLSCPQLIPPNFAVEGVASHAKDLQKRIASLRMVGSVQDVNLDVLHMNHELPYTKPYWKTEVPATQKLFTLVHLLSEKMDIMLAMMLSMSKQQGVSVSSALTGVQRSRDFPRAVTRILQRSFNCQGGNALPLLSTLEPEAQDDLEETVHDKLKAKGYKGSRRDVRHLIVQQINTLRKRPQPRIPDTDDDEEVDGRHGTLEEDRNEREEHLHENAREPEALSESDADDSVDPRLESDLRRDMRLNTERPAKRRRTTHAPPETFQRSSSSGAASGSSSSGNQRRR